MLKQRNDASENEEKFNEVKIQSTKGSPRFLGSCRFKLGVIMFLANVVLYLNRVNINIVVVCMLDVSEQNNDATMTTNFDTHNITNASQGHYSVRSVIPEIQKNERQHSWKTTAMSNMSNNHYDIPQHMNMNGSQHRQKFRWSKRDISHILSSYYYGCILTQIPGGNLSHRYGGKHVMTTCCILTLLGTLLTPLAASQSAVLLFVVRFLLGAAGGLFAPATYVLIVNWTTSAERASILGLAAAGQPIGIVISFISSGFFCSLGWSTIFYVHGAITCLFLFVWLYEVYNTPQEHPRIQTSELEYVTEDYTGSPKTEAPRTPWKSIFLSKAVWVAVLAHFAYLWSYYTFIINIPMFMKEVFEFVIEKNGMLSALPYIFSMISLISVGSVSGLIIKKQCFSLKSTRKLFAGLGLSGTSICLIGAGYVQYEQRYIAVVIICFSCVCSSLSFGGILPSYADFAGIFSGTIFAIGNTFGMAAVILSALSAGILTPNGLQEEWQRVFYVAASLNLVSMVVFVIFGRTSLQPWAMVHSKSQEISV